MNLDLTNGFSAEDVIALGAIVTAITLILAPIWRVVRVISSKLDTLENVQTKVEALAGEFKPNSGKTLRDSVNRIEERQGEQLRRLDVIEGRVNDHIDHHYGS